MTLKNNVIVTDALQKRLEVFTAGGASLSRWGLGKFYNPCAVAVSPNGNCVVTDTADHSVQRRLPGRTFFHRKTNPAEPKFS